MTRQSRRKFVASAAAITVGTVATAMTTATFDKKKKMQVTHHVFFWLKNRDSKQDRDMLIEGLRTLRNIKTVRKLHIGIPASTEERPVVDSSYSVSELMFFDDVAGQDAYQSDPIHLQFVEKYSHLWEKVVVYDSIEVE